jgi:hypothetical protein
VCTYACKEGLGGVLTQSEHILFYEYRKLKEHEINYVYTRLRVGIHSTYLKMWMHYLMDRKFELNIDHSVLKYLFEQPTLNVGYTRWMEFLREYDFDIKHIKEKDNKVVDALITRVHEMHDTTIIMYRTYFKDKILEAITTTTLRAS